MRSILQIGFLAMIDLGALLLAMIASMALGLMLMGSVFSMQGHTETQLALDLLEADQLDEQLGAETERLRYEHERRLWLRELRARRKRARREEGVDDGGGRSGDEDDGDDGDDGADVDRSSDRGDRHHVGDSASVANNSPIPWNAWVSRTFSG